MKLTLVGAVGLWVGILDGNCVGACRRCRSQRHALQGRVRQVLCVCTQRLTTVGAVGATVGPRVGNTVGPKLGARVGRKVGAWLGIVEGEWVGP
jgi:hypothetical protein